MMWWVWHARDGWVWPDHDLSVACSGCGRRDMLTMWVGMLVMGGCGLIMIYVACSRSEWHVHDLVGVACS